MPTTHHSSEKPAANKAVASQVQRKATVDNKNAVAIPCIQFKLSIGKPGDVYEQEADRIADKVMKMPAKKSIQRKCVGCKEEEKIHRKPIAAFIQKKGNDSGIVASDAVSNKINSTRGSGNKMDESTHSFMADRFGFDFSNVKIHTGNYAIQMSQELNAQAFTVGNDVYFNSGKYNPSSSEGKHLLAHELVHTVQQRNIISKSQKKKRPIPKQNIRALEKAVNSIKTNINDIINRVESAQFEIYGGKIIKNKQEGFNHIKKVENAIRGVQKHVNEIKSQKEKLVRSGQYGQISVKLRNSIEACLIRGNNIALHALRIISASKGKAFLFLKYNKRLPLEGKKIHPNEKKKAIDIFREVSKNPSMVKTSKLPKIVKGLRALGFISMIEAITNEHNSKMDVIVSLYGLKSRDYYLNMMFDKALEVYPELLTKELRLFFDEV